MQVADWFSWRCNQGSTQTEDTLTAIYMYVDVDVQTDLSPSSFIYISILMT